MKAKSLKIVMAFVAISVLLSSCDKLIKLANIKLDLKKTVEIPIEIVNKKMDQGTFSFSLGDIDAADEYLERLDDVIIKDIVLSIEDYKGDDITVQFDFQIGNGVVWAGNSIKPKEFSPLRLSKSPDFDKNVLKDAGKKLLDGSVVSGTFKTSSNTDIINTSFTVKCEFEIQVVANPLD